jgi:hypothetical protein
MAGYTVGMAPDDPKPDHTDDPRKQETGGGGYPETTPSGTEDEDAAKPDKGSSDSDRGAAA